MIIFYDLENEKLTYNKESLEELLLKNEGNSIFVSATCGSLVKDFADKIDRLKQQVNGRATVKINIEHQKEYVYDEKEVLEIKKLDDICKEKDVSMELRLGANASGSFQNFLIAREKIEDFAYKQTL